tara:strand:+ start:192 stop:686 length:495 start_codon:yes stop_codon:yes gene_type:complete
MALQTSGAISFANLQTELGGSNPITMGEYAAFRVSGSGNAISMNQFYGASASYTHSLNSFTQTSGNYRYTGHRTSTYSSISNLPSFLGTTTLQIFHRYGPYPNSTLRTYMSIGGIGTNSGFTTVTIDGDVYNRVDAYFYTYNLRTYWRWVRQSYWADPCTVVIA